MNFQFTKNYELIPYKNTKKYFLLFWFMFLIFSLCISFYTSCDYQSSIYTKGSCNKVLLTAGQKYPMKTVDDDTIYVTPLRDLKWDGRNTLSYNCYSDITFIKIDILNEITADINFLGSFICNNNPWLSLSKTNVEESPKWLKTIIKTNYKELNNNFTKPFTILYDILNKEKTIFGTNITENIIFDNEILNTISNYTEAVNNLDVGISYQCRSCYGYINTFDFQSFIRLIVTTSSILSFANIISTKLIPIMLKYRYEPDNNVLN